MLLFLYQGTENIHIGHGGSISSFRVARLRRATFEAFGTHLARMVDKCKLGHDDVGFPYVFYFPPIWSSW